MQLISNPKEYTEISFVIITGNCCFPGLAPLDQIARQAVQLVIKETGLSAQVKEITATAAMYGAVPDELKVQFIDAISNTGEIPLPAILLNGKVVSYGHRDLNIIKGAIVEQLSLIQSSELLK